MTLRHRVSLKLAFKTSGGLREARLYNANLKEKGLENEYRKNSKKSI